ncbi:MAG TPA: hypothetical protein PLE24_11865, partial [Chitinispirillaceae bacterium]|nr:hypothetical protein [Chitinispirillaceae bacterium]
MKKPEFQKENVHRQSSQNISTVYLLQTGDLVKGTLCLHVLNDFSTAYNKTKKYFRLKQKA